MVSYCVCCGVVWSCVAWCGMVWYGIIAYGVIEYGAVGGVIIKRWFFMVKFYTYRSMDNKRSCMHMPSFLQFYKY